MDRIQAICVFMQVVETGSFSKAAARLGLSPTSASRIVKDLEDFVGVRLLHRSTRSVTQTEAGAELYAHYGRIVADLEQVEAEAASATREASGRLRVALPHAFAMEHMYALLRDFRLRYPAITLDVSLSDSRVDLVQDGFDIAVRIAQQLPPTVVARRLTTIRTVLCAAPSYLAQHGEPARPQDLADHACLHYSLTAPVSEWHLTGPEGLVMQRVQGPVRANNGAMLRACALGGDGIILEPTFLVGDDLRAGRLVRILRDYETTPYAAYAIYPDRAQLPRKVRTFIDFVAERLADPPDWDRSL